MTTHDNETCIHWVLKYTVAVFLLWAQLCVHVYDLVPQNNFVTLNYSILYKTSMKFVIQEAPWISNFIDFLNDE